MWHAIDYNDTIFAYKTMFECMRDRPLANNICDRRISKRISDIGQGRYLAFVEELRDLQRQRTVAECLPDQLLIAYCDQQSSTGYVSLEVRDNIPSDAN
jgi:hypothetical protein